jgi:hypothetical protein
MASAAGTGDAIYVFGYRMPLPRSRLLRILIGCLLILGGVFSFLPILGVWMLPLGLVVLSIDIPRVRRWRRRFAVWFHRRYPKLAARIDPPPRPQGSADVAG